jgi:hypothetical protein
MQRLSDGLPASIHSRESSELFYEKALGEGCCTDTSFSRRDRLRGITVCVAGFSGAAKATATVEAVIVYQVICFL